MPWLRDEDACIKWRLQGLTVTDTNTPVGGRPVGVRFRLPQDELADLTYPVIIIEHAGIYPDQERMQSGQMVQIPYVPEGMTSWAYGTVSDPHALDPTASPYYTTFPPTPYNLDYQVTVYGRFWNQHIQPLIAELATLWRLPAKSGALWVPQTGTTRTMRLLGGPEEGYGLDEDGKRLFKVVYRVRVYTELLEDIQSSVAWGGTLIPVSMVNIDLSVYSDPTDIDLGTPSGITLNTGVLSAGLSSQVNVG
jgi:hypothetical protein